MLHSSFRKKRMHKGRTKKIGKLLITLSLCAEARGLFLRPSRDPMTQTRTRGLGKQPLLPNEKDARGSHKKDRETPDRPLAPCEGSGALPTTKRRPSDPGSHSRARQMNPPSEQKGCARVALPATRSKTSNPNSHSGARQNTIKGIEPVMV